MEIGRFEVLGHAQDHTGPGASLAKGQSRIRQCRGNNFQHQKLLRQDFGNLLGRQAVLSDWDFQTIKVRARQVEIPQQVAGDGIAAIPAIGRARSDGRTAAEDQLLKLNEGADRAEPRAHSHDGNRLRQRRRLRPAR
jgi:hypothetical protein